ncbi:MAG TPA: hypothetical protein V6D18_06000 [Thermosynechococcaceae cyanobacterium]
MPDRVYPRLEVFERLQISDGMTINADRWQQSHNYHRHRQNFHYQALYKAGIVYGLGVAIAPEQPDHRLLQVQPGIAIDISGNPIVVPRPEEFRLDSDPSEGQVLLVYLVVNHVDPDDLRRNSAARAVQETFRIVEKLHLDPHDVEICRIELQSGVTQLQVPVNVFLPGLNQLDFRGRCQPQPQPQFHVQVGQVTIGQPSDVVIQTALMDLQRSLPGLYPTLHSNLTVQSFTAQGLGREAINCQLLHIPYRVLLTLPNPGIQRLQAFLAQGGVVLTVADFAEVDLLDLLDIGQELQSGLLEAKRDRDLFDQTGAQLQEEIAANQSALVQQISEIEQPLAAIAYRLGLSLTESGELHDEHPLRWQPFAFSQLPDRQGHPIIVRNWGGLVLMIGDLTQCWGRNATPPVPREALRSAQEWGINLLHFAAQRCHWTQALTALPTATDARPDSLQHRTQPT